MRHYKWQRYHNTGTKRILEEEGTVFDETAFDAQWEVLRANNIVPYDPPKHPNMRFWDRYTKHQHGQHWKWHGNYTTEGVSYCQTIIVMFHKDGAYDKSPHTHL